MKQITGLVIEIKKKTCIILTPQGEFREVARPVKNVRIGEEITSAPVKILPAAWWKPLLAAACVCLFLSASFLYYRWSKEAIAYVGLDINPSVELGVNRRQLVCESNGLDADGEKLLQQVTVRGRPVNEAVEALVAGAVTARFLKPGEAGIILTTVTAAKEEIREIPDKQLVLQSVEKALRTFGVQAEVVAEQTPPQVRRQAREAGLSTGKYLLHLRAAQKGRPVSIEELREKTITELEIKKHFKTEDLIRPLPERQQEKKKEPPAGKPPAFKSGAELPERQGDSGEEKEEKKNGLFTPDDAKQGKLQGDDQEEAKKIDAGEKKKPPAFLKGNQEKEKGPEKKEGGKERGKKQASG